VATPRLALSFARRPFEDGVTSLVTFVAGQSGDVPMPGSADISLFFLGIPLGTSTEPVCPAADPEPCPWVAGDIESSFELPIDFGIGGSFVRTHATPAATPCSLVVRLSERFARGYSVWSTPWSTAMATRCSAWT
jgi:hypothetical protein